MRFLLFIFFLSTSLSAQDTFIKLYDLDATGGSFYNSLVFEDTLIFYGTAKSNDGTQWGLVWVQCDTSGNIIQQKIHLDILGDNYSLNNGYEMIKTSDGGYAMVGSLFSRKRGFFMKLDVNGDLEFVKEYPDDDINVVFQDRILEREDGYLISGDGQMLSDYRQDAFIRKTDLNGNELWRVTYGAEDLTDILPSVHPTDEGEIVMIGLRSTGFSLSPGSSYPHPDDAWHKFLVVRIDEDTGAILSEEISEEQEFIENENGSVVHHMYQDEDGNFIQPTVSYGYKYFSGDPTPIIISENRIIKRDVDLNIIWNTPFGIPAYRNRIYEVIPTSDDGWLAVGRARAPKYPENYDLGSFVAGTLAKVNEIGELQWMRTDTFFYAANFEQDRIEHILNSVVTLPSGSIIATGRVENYNESPARSYGWMIKLDKDGCLTPGCHPNLTGVNFSDLLTTFDIFPNPTSDYVVVEGIGAFSTEVYDNMGRRILDREEFVDSGILDFTLLPKGVYFVNIQTEGYLILSKKVSRL